MSINFFRNYVHSFTGNRQSGFAVLTSVVFFLFISLAITSGLVSPTVRELKISGDLLNSKQSMALSESAAEDSYYRLKTAKTIGGTNTIALNGHSLYYEFSVHKI